MNNVKYKFNIALSKLSLSLATIATINLLDFLLSTDGILMSDFIPSLLLSVMVYFSNSKIELSFWEIK